MTEHDVLVGFRLRLFTLPARSCRRRFAASLAWLLATEGIGHEQ
jgi:hypothetical protein